MRNRIHKDLVEPNITGYTWYGRGHGDLTPFTTYDTTITTSVIWDGSSFTTLDNDYSISIPIGIQIRKSGDDYEVYNGLSWDVIDSEFNPTLDSLVDRYL